MATHRLHVLWVYKYWLVICLFITESNLPLRFLSNICVPSPELSSESFLLDDPSLPRLATKPTKQRTGLLEFSSPFPFVYVPDSPILSPSIFLAHHPYRFIINKMY